jgi:hypothetical protein
VVVATGSVGGSPFFANSTIGHLEGVLIEQGGSAGAGAGAGYGSGPNVAYTPDKTVYVVQFRSWISH